MGMEKKNPYVTTIGFNRRDPNHVRVAEFLNEMGRGKAQYIVNAVMAYQNGQTGNTSQNLTEKDIREMIADMIRDHKTQKEELGFKEKDANIIMDSLKLFKA